MDIADIDIKVTEGDTDVRLPSKNSCKTRVLKLSGVAMDNNQCHLLSEFDDVTNKSSDCDVINRRSKPIVTLKPDEFKSLRKKFESGSRIMKSVTGDYSSPKSDLKIPLVRVMQQNEKRLAERMKIKKEKDSVKKMKKIEKEFKTDSERKRIKEKAELQKSLIK